MQDALQALWGWEGIAGEGGGIKGRHVSRVGRGSRDGKGGGRVGPGAVVTNNRTDHVPIRGRGGRGRSVQCFRGERPLRRNSRCMQGASAGVCSVCAREREARRALGKNGLLQGAGRGAGWRARGHKGANKPTSVQVGSGRWVARLDQHCLPPLLLGETMPAALLCTRRQEPGRPMCTAGGCWAWPER